MRSARKGVSVCLCRSEECVTEIHASFVSMCLHLSVQLQAVLPPLTAAAEGRGEAVKAQANKPYVSNSKPDITPALEGLPVCVKGNVCHLNKCLRTAIESATCARLCVHGKNSHIRVDKLECNIHFFNLIATFICENQSKCM